MAKWWIQVTVKPTCELFDHNRPKKCITRNFVALIIWQMKQVSGVTEVYLFVFPFFW